MCKYVVILATVAAFCHLTLGGRTIFAYQKPSYSDFTSILKGYSESRGYPEMKHKGYFNYAGPLWYKMYRCHEEEWDDSKQNKPHNWYESGSEGYGGERGSEGYGDEGGSEAYSGGSHWRREEYPRQNQGWIFDHFQPWTTTRAPETVPPMVLTTQSPLKVVMCIQSCPVTPQYNPVCGTNGKTYGNIGRLECAQYCGVDVSLAFPASCSQPVQTTTTAEPTRYTTIEASTNNFPTEPIAVTPPFDTPVTSLPVETTTEDAPDIDIRFPEVAG